jgi:hypothetical protein
MHHLPHLRTIKGYLRIYGRPPHGQTAENRAKPAMAKPAIASPPAGFWSAVCLDASPQFFWRGDVFLSVLTENNGSSRPARGSDRRIARGLSGR